MVLARPELDVGWREVLQALVIATMIVVLDEAADVGSVSYTHLTLPTN